MMITFIILSCQLSAANAQETVAYNDFIENRFRSVDPTGLQQPHQLFITQQQAKRRGFYGYEFDSTLGFPGEGHFRKPTDVIAVVNNKGEIEEVPVRDLNPNQLKHNQRNPTFGERADAYLQTAVEKLTGSKWKKPRFGTTPVERVRSKDINQKLWDMRIPAPPMRIPHNPPGGRSRDELPRSGDVERNPGMGKGRNKPPPPPKRAKKGTRKPRPPPKQAKMQSRARALTAPTRGSYPKGEQIKGHMIRREFLSTITASVGFTTGFTSPVNPGLATLLDWGSGIANHYQEYRINSCSFDYVPASGSAISGTSASVGSIVMYVDEDANNLAPTTFQQAEEYNNRAAFAPYNKCSYKFVAKGKGRGWKYVRTALLATAAPNGGAYNPHDYDVGNFYLLVNNCPGNGTSLGNLYINYDISFRYPAQISNLITEEVVGHFYTNGTSTAAAPLTGLIGAVDNGLTFSTDTSTHTHLNPWGPNSGSSSSWSNGPYLLVITAYQTAVTPAVPTLVFQTGSVQRSAFGASGQNAISINTTTASSIITSFDYNGYGTTNYICTISAITNLTAGYVDVFVCPLPVLNAPKNPYAALFQNLLARGDYKTIEGLAQYTGRMDTPAAPTDDSVNYHSEHCRCDDCRCSIVMVDEKFNSTKGYPGEGPDQPLLCTGTWAVDQQGCQFMCRCTSPHTTPDVPLGVRALWCQRYCNAQAVHIHPLVWCCPSCNLSQYCNGIYDTNDDYLRLLLTAQGIEPNPGPGGKRANKGSRSDSSNRAVKANIRSGKFTLTNRTDRPLIEDIIDAVPEGAEEDIRSVRGLAKKTELFRLGRLANNPRKKDEFRRLIREIRVRTTADSMDREEKEQKYDKKKESIKTVVSLPPPPRTYPIRGMNPLDSPNVLNPKPPPCQDNSQPILATASPIVAIVANSNKPKKPTFDIERISRTQVEPIFNDYVDLFITDSICAELVREFCGDDVPQEFTFPWQRDGIPFNPPVRDWPRIPLAWLPATTTEERTNPNLPWSYFEPHDEGKAGNMQHNEHNNFDKKTFEYKQIPSTFRVHFSEDPNEIQAKVFTNYHGLVTRNYTHNYTKALEWTLLDRFGPFVLVDMHPINSRDVRSKGCVGDAIEGVFGEAYGRTYEMSTLDVMFANVRKDMTSATLKGFMFAGTKHITKINIRGALDREKLLYDTAFVAQAMTNHLSMKLQTDLSLEHYQKQPSIWEKPDLFDHKLMVDKRHRVPAAVGIILLFTTFCYSVACDVFVAEYTGSFNGWWLVPSCAFAARLITQYFEHRFLVARSTRSNMRTWWQTYDVMAYVTLVCVVAPVGEELLKLAALGFPPPLYFPFATIAAWQFWLIIFITALLSIFESLATARTRATSIVCFFAHLSFTFVGSAGIIVHMMTNFLLYVTDNGQFQLSLASIEECLGFPEDKTISERATMTLETVECEEENRPVAWLYGIGAIGAIPKYFKKCTHNAMRALCGRHIMPVIYDKTPAIVTASWRKTAYLFDKVADSYRRAGPTWYSFLVWVRKYPRSLIDQLFLVEPARWRESSARNTFIKHEPNYTLKTPRLIQGLSKWYKVFVGPLTHHMTKILAQVRVFGIIYTGGMDSDSLATAWMENWYIARSSFKNPVVVEIDQSRFDAHVSPACFEMFHNFMSQIGIKKNIMEKFDELIFKHGRIKGIRYTTTATMDSGHGYTTCMNTILNMVMCAMIFGENVPGFVAGDDSLIFCDASQTKDIEKRFAEFGFSAKVKVHDDPYAAEYCSNLILPAPDGPTCVPKLFKFTYKFGWSRTKLNHKNQKHYRNALWHSSKRYQNLPVYRKVIPAHDDKPVKDSILKLVDHPYLLRTSERIIGFDDTTVQPILQRYGLTYTQLMELDANYGKKHCDLYHEKLAEEMA